MAILPVALFRVSALTYSRHMASFGIVGLGRIGGGLAQQAHRKGHSVVGYDPGPSVEGVVLRAKSLADLCALLSAPRLVFLYVPAGAAVDDSIQGLVPHLEAGDILVDGGNSYWRDTQARASELATKGIRFVDLGTSGGLSGARDGACFMAGGEPAAFEAIAPILNDLAVPGGVVFCGPSGSGHFVKLVHNGIEFGMLQAIGEGIDLLEKFDAELPIPEVVGAWRHGSVVRSWLVDLMHEALLAEPALDEVPGYVEDTGEVNWLIEDAMRMEVPVPVIGQSVMQLFASRDGRRTWARAIAMMRHGFGAHPYGPKEDVRAGRRTSRRER